MILNKNQVNINFNFGISIEISNIPEEYLVGDNQLYLITGFDGVAYDNIYINNNSFFVIPVNYYKEWRIELWGNYQKKFQRLYKYNFNLLGKKTFFHLQPQSKIEFDIWAEYLKYFEKRTKSKVYLIEDEYSTQQNHFDLVLSAEEQPFYASYYLGWVENKMVNPFGINFNSYDLINNKLFRI